MEDRFAASRRRLEQAVLDGAGETAPSLRRAAAERGELPEELRALVEKVHLHAYKITDEDLADLRARYSEDQVFEVVVAAALGAALHRLRAGMRALEGA